MTDLFTENALRWIIGAYAIFAGMGLVLGFVSTVADKPNKYKPWQHFLYSQITMFAACTAILLIGFGFYLIPTGKGTGQ